MNKQELENMFTYHAPFGDQVERYQQIRAKFLETALLVTELTPDSDQQAACIIMLHAASLMANAAIACNEVNVNEEIA